MVGLCQILDIYSKASLHSQYASHFATTVLQHVTDAISELKALAKNWSWNTDNLKLAEIGCPNAIISDLKNGVYKPFVSHGAKQRRVQILNIERAFRRDFVSEIE